MSRAKKGVTSEGKVPAQQEENAVNPLPFSIEQLRELLKETKDEAIRGLEEETKKLSDHIQALELKQQQTSPARKSGAQEEMSGERDDYATKAAGQEVPPPEQQLRQAASSSCGPSPFIQLGSRGRNLHRYHTKLHSPSLP